MKINLRAHNFEVSDQLKEYIEKKVMVLEKYLSTIDIVHVELKGDAHHKKGEVANIDITANVTDSGDVFRVEVSASDMHEAVDLAIPKLKQQIEGYKGKRTLDKNQVREVLGK